MDSVDLFEIKDTELEQLERGSPADIYLNFAILSFSTALTAFITLCTVTQYAYPTAKTIFIVITVVGTLATALLFTLWFRGKSDLKVIIKEIRNRIPPDAAGIELPIESALSEEVTKPKEPSK